jgi:glycosyltransferase involved in cell wall biosynthesis
VVAAIPRVVDGFDRVHVVVLDDGSRDNTAAIAAAAGAEVLRHDTNRGLGATFREAVEYALRRRSACLVNIDGDGQFDPADIPKIVAPIVAGQAEMATASRFLDATLVPTMPAIKRWGNRAVARVVRLLSGSRFADVSCGFRAFSREALLRMTLFGTFTYTQETFLDLLFKGLPIVEVPVRVRGVREFGSSRIASNIPRYAVRSLQIMLRAFLARRPMLAFGGLALGFGTVGASLLGFLAWHYLDSGAFSPHIWAGFTGAAFAFLAVTTLITGFLAENLFRVLALQEHTLYLLRRAMPPDPP